MKIDLMEPKPLENSLEPAVEFPLTLTYNSLEAPLSIKGLLVAEDNKVLAPLSDVAGMGTAAQEIGNIGAQGTMKDQDLRRESKHNVSVIAILSQRALDHIDSVRDKNIKGDVILKLILRVRLLKSKAVTPPLHYKAPSEIGPPLRERLNAMGHHALITYRPDRDYQPEVNNLWVISGSGEPVFLSITDLEQEITKTIYASNWVHDFAPQLGLGRFVLAELPIPVPVTVRGKHSRRLDKAFEALRKIEEKIKEGEWSEAIEKSRSVAELLRQEEMVKSILFKHGYREDAADSLLGAIRNLFDYSAKFLHKVDKDGTTIPPEIKAEKEDAYLTHSVSTALVNLLTRKAQKPE